MSDKEWLQQNVIDAFDLGDEFFELESSAMDCTADYDGAEELFNELIGSISDEEVIAFLNANKDQVLDGLYDFIGDLHEEEGIDDDDFDMDDMDDSEEEESLTHLKSFERFDNLYYHPREQYPDVKKGNISDYDLKKAFEKVLKTKPLSYWMDYASEDAVEVTNPEDLQDEIYELEREYALEDGVENASDETIYWSKYANAEMKALGILLIWATGKANLGIIKAYATQYAK